MIKQMNQLILIFSLILILGEPAEIREKSLHFKTQLSEEEVFELSFPLGIADRLPVEGRIVNLIKGAEHQLIWINESGKVTGYNLKERKVTWHFDLFSPPIGHPLIVGDILLIQDEGNNVLAFSKEGKFLWRKAFELSHSPILNFKERVIISQEDGFLVALNPQTAETIWSTMIGQKIEALIPSEKGAMAVSQGGRIYLISPDGQLLELGLLKEKILPYGLVSGDYLFLGSQDKAMICWHLKKKKKAWSIKLGGWLVNFPLTVGKNLYVATSNAVIYCLNQKSGEIQWWRSIPSRQTYRLVSAGPYLIVATINPPILAFDLTNGQIKGEFKPEGEICFSPLVDSNRLILPIYEPQSDQGFLLFLEPDIRVILSSSMPSPQKMGTEIIFSAEAIGFEKPSYEFFLQSGDRRKIVQKESARPTWTWLPLSPGDYVIGVRVKDKKKIRERTISFQIIKDKP